MTEVESIIPPYLLVHIYHTKFLRCSLAEVGSRQNWFFTDSQLPVSGWTDPEVGKKDKDTKPPLNDALALMPMLEVVGGLQILEEYWMTIQMISSQIFVTVLKMTLKVIYLEMNIEVWMRKLHKFLLT